MIERKTRAKEKETSNRKEFNKVKRKNTRTHRAHKPSNKLLLLFWYLANVNRARLCALCICVCVRTASIQYHSFAYIHKKRTQFNR